MTPAPTADPHLVSRIVWDCDFDVAAEVRAQQDWLSEFSHRSLPALLCNVFDRCCPQGQTWRCESLEIDLGTIRLSRADTDLPDRLATELASALRRRFGFSGPTPQPPYGGEDGDADGVEESEIALLDHLLTRGTLPWWQTRPVIFLNLWQHLLSTRPQDLLHLLRRIAQQEAVRFRLVWHLGSRHLPPLVRLAEPTHADALVDWVEGLVAHHVEERLVQDDRSGFEHAAWVALLTCLFTERGSLFNKVEFASAHLRHLARSYNIAYGVLLGRLEAISIQLAPHLPPRFLALIRAVLARDTPERQHHPNPENDPRAEQEWALWSRMLMRGEGEATDSADSTRIWLQTLFTRLANRDGRRMARSMLAVGAPAGATLARHLDDKPLRRVVTLLQPGEADFIIAHVSHSQRLAQHEHWPRRAVWDVVLTFLLSDHASRFERRQLVEHTLHAACRRHNTGLAQALTLLIAYAQVASPDLRHYQLLQILLDLHRQLTQTQAPEAPADAPTSGDITITGIVGQDGAGPHTGLSDRAAPGVSMGNGGGPDVERPFLNRQHPISSSRRMPGPRGQAPDLDAALTDIAHRFQTETLGPGMRRDDDGKGDSRYQKRSIAPSDATEFWAQADRSPGGRTGKAPPVTAADVAHLPPTTLWKLLRWQLRAGRLPRHTPPALAGLTLAQLWDLLPPAALRRWLLAQPDRAALLPQLAVIPAARRWLTRLTPQALRPVEALLDQAAHWFNDTGSSSGGMGTRSGTAATRAMLEPILWHLALDPRAAALPPARFLAQCLLLWVQLLSVGILAAAARGLAAPPSPLWREAFQIVQGWADGTGGTPITVALPPELVARGAATGRATGRIRPDAWGQWLETPQGHDHLLRLLCRQSPPALHRVHGVARLAATGSAEQRLATAIYQWAWTRPDLLRRLLAKPWQRASIRPRLEARLRQALALPHLLDLVANQHGGTSSGRRLVRMITQWRDWQRRLNLPHLDRRDGWLWRTVWQAWLQQDWRALEPDRLLASFRQFFLPMSGGNAARLDDQLRGSPPPAAIAPLLSISTTRSERPPMSTPHTPALGQRMPVTNAGLVLLQSYLPMLFDRMGLTQDRQITSPTGAQRGVLALQYLACGIAGAEEPHLVLNKLLCGIDPATPVPLRTDLTEQETSLLDGLLNAAIRQWTAIGSSSLSGFRGNWLLRQGMIADNGDHWGLTVEKRAYDVLIRQAPFSFSVVKYPWMAKALYVTWPH